MIKPEEIKVGVKILVNKKGVPDLPARVSRIDTAMGKPWVWLEFAGCGVIHCSIEELTTNLNYQVVPDDN